MTPEMILAAFSRHGDPDVRLGAGDLANAWTALQTELAQLKSRVAAADRAIAERDRRIEAMATTSLRAQRQATGDVPVVVERRPDPSARPARTTGEALVVEKVSAQIGDRDAASVAARTTAPTDGPSWREPSSADRVGPTSAPRERSSAEQRLFAAADAGPQVGGTTRAIANSSGNTSVLMAVLTGTHASIAADAAPEPVVPTSTPNVFDAADLIGEPKTLRLPPPMPTQPAGAANGAARPTEAHAVADEQRWSHNEIELDEGDEDDAFLRLQESFVDSGRFDEGSSTAVGRFRTASRN